MENYSPQSYYRVVKEIVNQYDKGKLQPFCDLNDINYNDAYKQIELCKTLGTKEKVKQVRSNAAGGKLVKNALSPRIHPQTT